MQEAVRKAQEEFAKQKEVIVAQDIVLKVNTMFPCNAFALVRKDWALSLLK